ncbi:MAG: hypothetical protein IJU81_00050 [Bacteroidales bacterium]|nr:hypothetical protein [Bacteroidales bacterium]
MTANSNERIAELRRLLANYEELAADQDDDAYVARGNGFCDSKYSQDFIEGQIERIKAELSRLE